MPLYMEKPSTFALLKGNSLDDIMGAGEEVTRLSVY